MIRPSPSHRVSFETIRALAIECHALDVSGGTLFVTGTHSPSRSTGIAYEELVSAKLLMLAVSIRTKFYQGLPWQDTDKYVNPSGFLDYIRNGVEESKIFTIKDVCDKIIHAESIDREIDGSKFGHTTSLHGNDRKMKWTLHISVSLFAEGILNWLDEIPEA